MGTRQIVHTEDFEVTVEQLFDLLMRPSAIRQWWSAAQVIIVPMQNGSWAITWGEDEDKPDYASVATIAEYEPPRRLVLADYRYTTPNGKLPFEADFRTEFLVAPTDSGASLQVVQDGFPLGSEADEFYAGCQKGWANTFAGIRRFLGDAKPES